MSSFMVVTRLRLRDPVYRDDFLSSALAVIEQATAAPGNRGVDALADAGDVYWTRTAWSDPASMRAFMLGEPHVGTMSHIDDWCDEATFVNWEQDAGDLPDWGEASARLIAHGQVVSLTSPSDEHRTKAFPPPLE